jgi:hypothetical protein
MTEDEMRKEMGIAAFLLIFGATEALAQNTRTFYDSRGSVTGKASTDSQGSTTFRDASGRVTGRESSGTIYDARGNKVGTVSPSQK